MPITKAHDRYMQLLLEKIAMDHYPSGELMDRVEIMLDREHVDTYVELLFEKIERDHFVFTIDLQENVGFPGGKPRIVGRCRIVVGRWGYLEFDAVERRC